MRRDGSTSGGPAAASDAAPAGEAQSSTGAGTVVGVELRGWALDGGTLTALSVCLPMCTSVRTLR